MAEYPMTLVDRQQIASDTMAFWFEPDDGYFEFRAGQHVDLVFAQPQQGCENDNFRTFSLASSPQEKKSIMIAMRMRKTTFKTALQVAAFGTKFVVSRARGVVHAAQRPEQARGISSRRHWNSAYSKHPATCRSGSVGTQTVFVLLQSGH